MKVQKTTKLVFTLVLLVICQVSCAQTTFTSAATGAWNNCATWGTCDGSGDNTAGDGYPSRTDFVVITGFQVNITATNQNGSAAARPRNLGIDGVCGCNAGCGNAPTGCNTDAFYQNKKIIINSGGILSTNVDMIIGDTLRINSGDQYSLINNNGNSFVIGFVNVKSGGNFTTNNHLIVSGSGVVTVESGATMIVGDDLFLDGDNSLLC